MKRFTVLFALALAALPLAAHAQSSVPTAAAASDAQSARAVPGDDSAPARALTPIEVTGRSYAQYLVDSTVARFPDLVGLDIHAVGPGRAGGTVVGSKSPERVGRASALADLEVVRTGQPRVEINRSGDQNAVVALALFDIYRQTIGLVEATFPYPSGADPDALVAQATLYRDDISRRILDPASLTAPVQVDPRVGAHGYAQFLVDDALAKHPRVEVLTLHAGTPTTPSEYPIIASNIGRLGQPADASDLAVLRNGQPHHAVDEKGRRYESKWPLLDSAGNVIGVVAIVWPYRAPLSNPSSLQAQSEAIRDELRARIANTAMLDEPYPAVSARAERRPLVEYEKPQLGNRQELPMTKEVVSGAALQQSTQEGYSEAIKNVAGLTPTNSSGSTNDSFMIRGIKLNLFSNYRLDGGVPIAGVITMPTEDKQRVETLKGANALMFGVASPAGIINFVTKRAGPRDITTLGLAGNLFGQYGGGVDIGRRFGRDNQFGVRLNGSATHLENGVRGLGGRGEFASLGFDWHATSRLMLQADVEYYARHQPEQAGISLLPAVKGVVPITPVPDPTNNLIDGWNEFSAHTRNYQLRADYVLSDAWKLLAQSGESKSHRDRKTVRIAGYDPVTGDHGTVTVQPITNDFDNRFFRVEALGHFSTWSLVHDLTVGYSHTERRSVSYNIANITLPQKQNIFDPIELAPPVIGKTTANPAQNSKDTGEYVYDALALTPRLKVLAGIRWVTDDEVVGSTTSTSNRSSPGYGVLYDVLPTTTLFASYLEGLEAGGTAPANAANANVILAPAVSRQKEIGLRDSYFKGLAISGSYFDITRANAVVDPVSNVFAYNGNLSYKGVESTVAYDFLRDWTANFAVLWLKAVQNSPLQPLIDGRAPENTPKWNGNAGLAWRVPAVPGLALRGGIRSIAKRPVNAQDQGYIPGYTLYDLAAAYATSIAGRRLSMQVTVDNVGNKRYWNSVTTGTYGIGMERSVRFSAKFDL